MTTVTPIKEDLMKLRLHGTLPECAVAAAGLRRTPGLHVVDQSRPYPDRTGELVRVYLTVAVNPARRRQPSEGRWPGWGRWPVMAGPDQLLCEACGWTISMVCPECPAGCGCSTGCSGWRHYEYRHHDDDLDDAGWECECGAGHEYHCVC